MRLRVLPLRFHLTAQDRVQFGNARKGAGAVPAANVFRGAIGLRLAAEGAEFSRWFAPEDSTGPSGLRHPPRPFVFRSAHLDQSTIEPGEPFEFAIHLFDVRPEPLRWLRVAVEQAGTFGVGFGSLGRYRLNRMEGEGSPVDLNPLGNGSGSPVDRLTIRFVTPTELKHQGELASEPEFAILLGRVRDRISTLCRYYSPEGSASGFDFEALGKRAAKVRMLRCEIQHVGGSRRSSRTGQTHPLGGFVGEAEYAGDLAEFVPWLQAAEWTGVGRQTSWGKGEIRIAQSGAFGSERVD